MLPPIPKCLHFFILMLIVCVRVSYEFGIGVSANERLAAELYSRGAETNHPQSIFNLADCQYADFFNPPRTYSCLLIY
jgi:hypothetical protein